MANPLQSALQRQNVEDMLGNKLGPLKPALSHIGLYLGLCVYTAIGAKVSIHTFGLIKLVSFYIIKNHFKSITESGTKSMDHTLHES